jgi:3'-phosphoadenosine 5'-phosphosulfate sulfotransferase (PAPS reductase)/FAD synthetase
MNLVSFGGGTNSAALIIGMHKKQIPIDIIIFSDTGGERPETYEFIELFNTWLVSVRLPPITFVQKTHHGFPYTLEEKLLHYQYLPNVAYGNGQCSVEFKIRPQEKHCNNYEKCKAIWERGEKVNKYIGYDAGEQRRVDKNKDKYAADKKYMLHFPLIEWGWGRAECVTAIEGEGLPLPGKSSCFYCPNNNKEEIRRLWEKHPDLFDRAVAIEHNAKKTKQDGSPSSIIGLGRTWTWESYREAYLELEAAKANQFVLPGFEDITGGCCCGMPCGCYDG